jgi:hypothetical protein
MTTQTAATDAIAETIKAIADSAPESLRGDLHRMRYEFGELRAVEAEALRAALQQLETQTEQLHLAAAVIEGLAERIAVESEGDIGRDAAASARQFAKMMLDPPADRQHNEQNEPE